MEVKNLAILRIFKHWRSTSIGKAPKAEGIERVRTGTECPRSRLWDLWERRELPRRGSGAEPRGSKQKLHI